MQHKTESISDKPVEQWPSQWQELIRAVGQTANSPGAYLYEAARRGHAQLIDNALSVLPEEEVKKIVNEKKPPFGNTPLHEAVDNGHVECVKVLLKHKADPDIRGFLYETPLHHAVFRNQAEIVSILLANKARCDVPRFDGEMPIHLAVSGGNLDVLRKLLDSNPEQIKLKASNDRTPLYRAVMDSKNEVAKELLSRGAKATELNAGGLAPVHLAADKNNAVLIEIMLSTDKSCVNFMDNTGDGLTPLQHCLMTRKPGIETAKVLIQNGADLNPENMPLFFLLARHADPDAPQTIEMMQLLEKHGAQWNATGKMNGETFTALELLEAMNEPDELEDNPLYRFLRDKNSNIHTRAPLQKT